MTFIICVFCTFKNKLTSRNCFICENSLEEKEEENKNEVNENNNNNKKNDNERVEDIIEIIEDEDIEIIEIIEEVKNDKRKRGNTLEKEKRNNNNNNINNNNNNQEEDEEEMIECPNCTFKNNKINKECELCSSLLKKRRVVSMNEDNDFEEKKVTTENTQISASVTPGLLPLIQSALEDEYLRDYENGNEKSLNQNSYRLCSFACPHISQKGVPMGGEWSCGYRNIQMLCHTLMSLPSYRRVLFNGTGEVPDVHGLQAWIERAWTNGFDVEGCNQLGGSLLGTSTWIGATECAALLRYMRVRCEVVDFCGLKSSMLSNKNSKSSLSSSKRTKGTKGTKSIPKNKQKIEERQSKITSFFDIPCDDITSTETPPTSSEPSLDMYHPLIQWVQIYFQTSYPRSAWDNETSTSSNSSTSSITSFQSSESGDFIPPLYFQQDGHSRTLVGYEIKSTGKCSLFIFDPNHHGTTFKTKLNERKGWQMMLKRGGHTLKRNEYQIVYVLPGLMDVNSEEYHNSKIISSVSVIS